MVQIWNAKCFSFLNREPHVAISDLMQLLFFSNITPHPPGAFRRMWVYAGVRYLIGTVLANKKQ